MGGTTAPGAQNTERSSARIFVQPIVKSGACRLLGKLVHNSKRGMIKIRSGRRNHVESIYSLQICSRIAVKASTIIEYYNRQ